jgi:hypothetical protein
MSNNIDDFFCINHNINIYSFMIDDDDDWRVPILPTPFNIPVIITEIITKIIIETFTVNVVDVPLVVEPIVNLVTTVTNLENRIIHVIDGIHYVFDPLFEVAEDFTDVNTIDQAEFFFE